MKILLKNARRLLHDTQTKDCDILIDKGTISKIAAEINEDADQRIDCKNYMVFPGFIDVHVHLREPGGEHKETIKTGSESAARGGFTTICAMPNTNPVPDNTEALQELKNKIDADACVRVLPYASITKGLKGNELTDISRLVDDGIFAFTDDGVGIQTADLMFRAMQKAAAQNKPVVAHCEDNSLVYEGVLHNGEVSERLGLPGIPSISESVQIARDVLLAEAAGCHYHVCHVSTKESVRIIRNAKKAGIHVTAEVTPHHLLLYEEAVRDDNADFKMNPPLRSKADQQALIDGLLDGTIDFIATDHAPHAAEEKAAGFGQAPFGIVGLETAFPLLYTYLVKTNKATLKELIDWITVKPANAFQLPYGVLHEGAVADLTVVDLNKSARVDKATFLSKGRNTPFHGWEVEGIPVLTLSEGKVVYQNTNEDNAITTN
ncbi:dihydroorotase [Lentibacillus persicus]|uniref:Dihydroorotase n=1 Tax=Lentibacillus persicus TaxID=640948 RepID=A0A1I1VJ69_9BACI|nr:dihydroorotase [Lentibacillus persicus]SFD82078.1 dihydroorotase [Lentibacillus persicus]